MTENLRGKEGAPSVAMQRVPDVYYKEMDEEEEAMKDHHDRMD